MTEQGKDTDRKLLFAALGFLAVLLRSREGDDQADERALTIAGLTESFCREHVPEAFEGDSSADDETVRDRMTSVIRDIRRDDGRCDRGELMKHGFSESEIRRHWLMAYALAGVSLNLKREVS